MGKKCCNPFNRPANHTKSASDLRPIPEQDLWKFRGCDESSLICSGCRKQLHTYEPLKNDGAEESQPVSENPSSQGSTVGFSEEDIKIDVFLGVSPVKRKRSHNKSYMGTKLYQMQEAVRKKFKTEYGVSPMTPSAQDNADYSEIIRNLKKDVQNCNQRSQKIELLSLLPRSWSLRKIIDLFEVTDCAVRDAKLLRKSRETSELRQENILGRPSLDSSIKNRVIEFYLDDENSRQQPGMNDYKSVVQDDGRRVLKQKKLIVCNLTELFESYKAEYPQDKIGLSKFCMLRPKHCILAGASGTHTVCVYIIHENVSLMLEGCSFRKLFKQSSFFNKEDVSINDILRKLVCLNPIMACYERLCAKCPPMTELHQHFSEVFEQNDIDDVNYRMWVTTDRCTILSVNQDAEEFLEDLMINLKKLLLHDFVAKNQAKFYSNLKKTLSSGEFAVVVDFAENISFLVQRAVSAFHWNNEQATLFPITVYFRVDGELRHFSYCAISNCLKHDSVAVYMFQKKLIELMKIRFGILTKMIYFSDGAPQQFKNKKAFGNLSNHSSDFDVEAEWHFFATAHGKGPCDGLAGCIKRNAARASLQNELILNAEQLFSWAKNAIKNVEFFYLSQDDYEATRSFLEEKRFPFCRTVKGTQSYHTVIPLPNQKGSVLVKTISDSNESKTVKVIEES